MNKTSPSHLQTSTSQEASISRVQSGKTVNKQEILSTDIALLFRYDPTDTTVLLARTIQLVNSNEMLVLLSLLKYYISITENRENLPLLVVLSLARAYSSINEHKLATEILQLYLEDDAYIAARAQTEGYESPFSCKLVLLLPYIIETHFLCGIGSPLSFSRLIFEDKDKIYIEKFSILFLCITDVFKLHKHAKELLETDKLFARVVDDVAIVHNIFTVKISATLGQITDPHDIIFLRHKIYTLRKHLSILIPTINASAFSSVSLVAKCILCFIELIKEYRFVLKENIAEQVFGTFTHQKVQNELSQLLNKSHILVLKAMTLYKEQKALLTTTCSAASQEQENVLKIGLKESVSTTPDTPAYSADRVDRIQRVTELLEGATQSQPLSSIPFTPRLTPVRQTLGPTGINGFTDISKPISTPVVKPDISLQSFHIGQSVIDLVLPRVLDTKINYTKTDITPSGSQIKVYESSTGNSIITSSDMNFKTSIDTDIQEPTTKISIAATALELWFEKTMQSKITFQILLYLANVLKLTQFNAIVGYDEAICFLSVILADFESHINEVLGLSDFLVLLFEILRMLMCISDHFIQKYNTVAYLLYSYVVKTADIYCEIECKIKSQFNMEEQYKRYLDPLREILRELSIIFSSQKLRERYSIDIAYENGDMFFVEILDGNLLHAMCLNGEYSVTELSRLATRRIALIEFTLSLALFNAKLYLDAVLWLERTTLHCGQLEDAWILLARAYLNIGEKEKSLNAAMMCYRLDPSNLRAKKYCEGTLPEIEAHVEALIK